ncbi:type II secretion system protein [Halopseudomonas sabulinigri]|uniref:Type II secretion system protein n=1 Tax=Halopseudomonas sabulinigri TaxID=472181 RepID=A0ABP9ZUP1_9GAMM
MPRCNGFTYVEVIVSLAILGLIASLCAPLWALQIERDKKQELRVALREIRSAIDEYHEAYLAGKIEQRTGDYGYPRSLKELVEGVPDVSRTDGRELYFLRRIPSNPYSKNSQAQDQWKIIYYRKKTALSLNSQELIDVSIAVHVLR